MEFRLSRKDEYEAIRKLWEQSFGAEEPWTGWFFSRHYRADQTWVALDNGTVVAQAHLLPHQLWLRGAWRQAVYFVGVCVEEELRGTGIGRNLMASALEELRRTGIGISILQPRWPAFYHLLGWDYCYSRQRYDLPVSEADRLLPENAPSVSWAPDVQGTSTLQLLYGSFVHSRHGYAIRKQKDWENLLADHRGEGGSVGIVACEGIPTGYVLYNTLGDVLRAREMICLKPWMVDAALRFLIGPVGMTGTATLEWDDPSGDPGSVLYSGSRSEPFLMGRVTDLQFVLESIAYPPGLSAEMDLTVTDSLAPWNQGCFRWSIRQGQGTLHPVRSGASYGISLDIGTLSQLVFGEYSARDLLSAGNGKSIREEDLERLEEIFPACRNFISEYF